ncbi:sigma factor [Nocardia sp. CC227C]|uniref:sigma factor n=1 Tax=Nocardia sp. CC227C TaxID=3044562 RepID=UPI00278BB341|nr:sigma factor [Nocardia sp. CC227C]
MNDQSAPIFTASHPLGGSDDFGPPFVRPAGWTSHDEGRRAVRDELIERYQPLAEHIAGRFAVGGANTDALLPHARAAVVLAVDRFDPGGGSSFLSFAVPTITGEVRRNSRDYEGAVWIPRWLARIRPPIGPAIDALCRRLGRMPTAGEIAAEVGGDRVEVTRALVVHNARRGCSGNGSASE